MKKMTIGKKITLGFAVMLMILVAVSIFAYTRIRVIHNSFTLLSEENVPTLELMGDLNARTREDQGIIYKHIYSPSEQDMNTLEAKLSANHKLNDQTYERLEKLETDAEGLAIMAKLKAARIAYRQIKNTIIAASHSSTNAEMSAQLCLRARAELDPVADIYMKAIDDGTENEKNQVALCVKENDDAIRNANVWLMIGSVSGLVLGTLLALVILNSISKVLQSISSSLSSGAAQVASAAGQVSSSSQSLAEGSSEQAASLEETSASLEELSSMTRRNSENAQQVNTLAKQSRTAADKGVGDMQSMNAAMDAIKASSDDIAKIIKTIDEIAFQTNILALNAAVEAARAGEAGMGFAVVADEVRNLAQRSAQAAKETAAKIEGAIAKTGQGVEISRKVGEALNEIVTKARQVDELAAEVATASREQTSGITQINLAVSQMDKVTQSNAANAEESAAAAEELNAQAAVMQQAVSELLEMVGGIRESHHHTTSKPTHLARTVRTHSPAPAKKVASDRASKTNGYHPAPALTASGSKRDEIPMDGDFKDF